MRKWKLSTEERISAVREYKEGRGSYKSIAEKYGIAKRTLRDMVAKWETFGEEGLETKRETKKYGKELKRQAVADYLSGKGSQAEICKKYKILSRTQLQNWITVYNGHKEFRNPSGGSGTEIYMAKGRKTSQKERAEIVAFCLEHGKDYSLTVQTYSVSYQQVYAWVRKYEDKGVDGLSDRRGKAKVESEMTEADKLRAENKILAAKIKDLEMENALIKKLKELERGGR